MDPAALADELAGCDVALVGGIPDAVIEALGAGGARLHPLETAPASVVVICSGAPDEPLVGFVAEHAERAVVLGPPEDVVVWARELAAVGFAPPVTSSEGYAWLRRRERRELARDLHESEQEAARLAGELEWLRQRAEWLEKQLAIVHGTRTIRWTNATRRRYGRARSWLKGLRAVSAAELPLDAQYPVWLRRNSPGRKQLAQYRHESGRLPARPLFSLVMPVYNSDVRWLRRAVESVRAQVYDRWELCIADDSSTSPPTLEFLRSLESDPRIRVGRLAVNGGIAAASNEALKLASGDFVAFVDHDDELKPHALFEVARLLAERPELDVVYSDEDRQRLDGPLERPYFKPDWSPDLLLSTNYLNHLTVIRRSIVEEVGGLRHGYDGSQDYDLVLRVTRVTKRVGHVPAPLYTWRSIPGSAAASTEAKPYAYPAAERALRDALAQNGVHATVSAGANKGQYHVRYTVPRATRATVVVAGSTVAEAAPLLRQLANDPPRCELEIVLACRSDTGADAHPQVAALVTAATPDESLPLLLTRAARHTTGEALIFVGGEQQPVTPRWIEALLEHALREPVGAVSGRLLGPDGSVEDEGLVLGGEQVATPVAASGYFGLGQVVRNVAAVSASCLATRASMFDRLGGFDGDLGSLFDVDYCMKARSGGAVIVYTPYAVLRRVGDRRRDAVGDAERERFLARWGDEAQRDPYYNPNLSLVRPYTLRLAEPNAGSSRYGSQKTRS